LLAEGLTICATARLLEVDKDTVCGWLPGLGQHGARVMAYHFRHLPLTECQLDELWTFVYKKEEHLDAIERLAGVYGEAWIGVAFAPVSVDPIFRSVALPARQFDEHNHTVARVLAG